MRPFDVVIVGAGPAGSVLAYLLSRSGVRTALVERHRDLDREFRGYFFQPVVLRLLDEMGLLDEALALEHWRVREFHHLENGERLFTLRFDALPPPYDFGVNMRQAPLLELLLGRAEAIGPFEYLPATSARELVREGERFSGVVAGGARGSRELAARLVIGADGRYSTIRRLAGIPMMMDPIEYDLLWFSLPLEGAASRPLQVAVSEGRLLVQVPISADRLQVGWLIEKGSYAEVRSAGLPALHDQISIADPVIGSHVREHLEDFAQCSLLPVQSGIAETWVADGLLLMGDAAHVASPFSGQGNSLAVQDAVVAHDVIVRALRRPERIVRAEALRDFETERRRDVLQIAAIQRAQARLLTGGDEKAVRRRQDLARRIRRSPLLAGAPSKLAVGVRPVRVATEHFVGAPAHA